MADNRYRVLNPENEADRALITYYQQHIGVPLEGEPQDALRAWILYKVYAGPPNNYRIKDLKEIFDMTLKDNPLPDRKKSTYEAKLAQWQDWSLEWDWEERMLVVYYNWVTSNLV